MTKPVQLSDDAYARLSAEKRPGESFSDVVLRLTRKPSLAAVLPRRPRREVAAHERLLRELGDLDRADMERTLRKARR